MNSTTPSLLGRVDVEALAGEFVDAFADALDLSSEARGEPGQDVFVDAYAGLFHAVEHRSERQVDVNVDAGDFGFVSVRAQDGHERMR